MTRMPSRPPILPVCLVAAIAAVVPAVVSGPVQAQEIVQPLPDPATEELSEALRRLSRNPESVPALVAAGRASLELDDVDAALGFFSRAQAVEPEDGRVLLGLALVAVRRGEAVTALQLFRNAEAAGERMTPHAAERGLAYDLVGRNDRAQRLYRQALSQEESPEVTRRLALSYAIAGDPEASEQILLPLLQRQDRAAFRTRAFALAISGKDEEAVAIAETMLPARISNRLSPYLRYMPRLTRAQQAAAANLGRFPAATDMGRDSADIAAYADQGETPSVPPRAQQASAAERLEPQGEPLGPASPPVSAANDMPAPAQGELPAVEDAQVAEQASSSAAPSIVEEDAPALAEASAAAPPPPASQPSPVVVATLETQPANPPAEAARPSFSIAEPTVADAPPEEQDAPIDLAEAFSDFTLEEARVPAVAGAVDITAFEPPRERPQPVEPPPLAHPTRHWVQVATGQDISAFRFDWRRIVRSAGTLLEDADAFTAKWGQTNRLLTGPFDTASAAQDMVSALAAEGVDSFRFTSEEGEEIQSLD